jgi:hypothetical protein
MDVCAILLGIGLTVLCPPSPTLQLKNCEPCRKRCSDRSSRHRKKSTAYTAVSATALSAASRSWIQKR